MYQYEILNIEFINIVRPIMRKNKRSSNNSSFITNHQLIEWVKTKSSSQIQVPVSTCSTISLIAKKQEAHNQYCEGNSNDNPNKKSFIQSNNYCSKRVQNLEQAIACILKACSVLKQSKQYKSAYCQLLNVLPFLTSFKQSYQLEMQKRSQFIVQRNFLLQNIKLKQNQIQHLKQTLNNEKRRSQAFLFRNAQNLAEHPNNDKKQNRNPDINRRMENRSMKQLKQQLNAKCNRDQKPSSNTKDGKLHKIILKQSQIIQRQQEDGRIQKQSLLGMLQSQAKTIQEYLHGSKQNIGASLKFSIDLDSYLLSSVNQKDTNRY